MSFSGFLVQGIVLRDGDDAYLQFLFLLLHRSSRSGWTVADHSGDFCIVVFVVISQVHFSVAGNVVSSSSFIGSCCRFGGLRFRL